MLLHLIKHRFYLLGSAFILHDFFKLSHQVIVQFQFSRVKVLLFIEIDAAFAAAHQLIHYLVFAKT